MLCQQTYALPIPLLGPRCRAPSACPEGLQRLLTPGGSCKHAFPLAPGMQTMQLSGFNHACLVGLEERSHSAVNYARLEQLLNHQAKLLTKMGSI